MAEWELQDHWCDIFVMLSWLFNKVASELLEETPELRSLVLHCTDYADLMDKGPKGRQLVARVFEKSAHDLLTELKQEHCYAKEK